ncbi:uncharacterized protein LOC125059907 isoform X2 [Pieris napi]|uniref:uncharacterized protein LOC125059907 isoform X2 n=1 Tax=Pieris napi TaxID=78633 RepID=UPI001FBA8DB5|nr:uncharacterized protein LOC125059907 isoform X2 [Pieris napi]
MNNAQEEVGNDMCKNHTGRSEKDFYRICPSKLSKRELEDMYFALVENNMDLKKTANGQREQIKLLNTKVQRMMAQRPTTTRELKECCINNKAIINEQKDVIADLKKSNDRLTERIRLLNMRLCSAKQFLKKGQLPNSARCPKCCNGVPVSVKNSSTTGLITEHVEPSVKSANASCQYLANVTSPTPGSSAREQPVAPDKTNELCDQNKCRTAMEELKEKTLSLQEELSQTHAEYASRIKKLEDEMTRLNTENVRVRSESTSSEHRMEQQSGEISDLLQRLRKCEAQCEHLTVQLKIERSRSAELEMQSKALDMSSAIATAVEQHLAGLNLKKEEVDTKVKRDMSAQSIDNSSMYHCQFQLIVPNNSISSQTDKVSETSAEKFINRPSDDSGYTDNSNASCEGENRDIDFDESILLRRKSCLERPSCSKKDDCTNPPVPGDRDFLIRTNRLNSFKSTQEWCKDYDRSDTGSSICDNRSLSDIKDKEKCNSDKENYTIEQNCEKDIFNDKDVPKLDLSDVNESSEGNKTYRKDDDEKNAIKSSDSFHFTKEMITKIDGKLVSKPFHEIDRKSSIDDFETERDDYKENNYLTGLSNIKETSISQIESKEIDRQFVSTGVDPIDRPLDRFKETGVHTDETAMSLLEKNRLEICEQSVRVCTCPESARRGTSMFRSCSGTLRFTTTTSNSKFRKCNCADNLSMEIKGVKDSQTYVRKTSTPHGTFVLQGEAMLDAMSPNTTGCEVSSLTDLPSEREAVSAQTSLGEDKGTYTQSDETPRSTTDYGSLSEGEVPTTGHKRPSIGEAPPDINLRRRETSTSEKMEDTLRAISEELSRCRHLLQMQSSHEVIDY